MGMALWVMMALGIAWQLLGEDFAVDPQTNRATAAWIALNLPLSFLGALLGGWLTASIARAKADSAVRALASLVVVLGLAMAVHHNVSRRQRTRKSLLMSSSRAAATPP